MCIKPQLLSQDPGDFACFLHHSKDKPAAFFGAGDEALLDDLPLPAPPLPALFLLPLAGDCDRASGLTSASLSFLDKSRCFKGQLSPFQQPPKWWKKQSRRGPVDEDCLPPLLAALPLPFVFPFAELFPLALPVEAAPAALFLDRLPSPPGPWLLSCLC